MTRCFQISQNYLRWFSCLFGKFKAFLKISWGNFSRRFRQLFRLISETCVTTRLDGSGRKLKDKEEPYSHQTILGDVLSMNRNFQETFVKNNRNIWEIKLWKHNFIKSQVSGVEKQRISQTNAWLSLLRALEIDICSFEQLSYRKKSLGAPEEILNKENSRNRQYRLIAAMSRYKS